MEIALLFGVFAILLIAGVPIAFALSAATLATVVYLGLPPIVVVQQVSSGFNKVSLLAIPLFIFTGELMMRGGISDRLISLASSLVGHLRGGLGQVSVLASTMFGGVSGSALADVSAIGPTMIPQMAKRGFSKDYAVDVTISAALVALLLPPSHNLILFSAVAGGGVSIADLFAAGIVPALLLALSVMGAAWWLAKVRGYPVETFPGWGAVLSRLVAAIPGLLMIFVIFGGIRAGIFTAVESSAIAVLYALAVMLLIYRTLGWKDFSGAAAHAARASATVLFVIGAAGAFGWLIAYLEIPSFVVETLNNLTDERNVALLLMVIALLIMGTFLDLAPKIIIVTPIFLPVARSYGVEPLHFGVIMVLAGGIGLIMPPIGSVLFVGSAIGKISIAEAMKSIWPFFISAIIVLLLVTFIPALSLTLPALWR
ncbi:TRAP transporter large permease [Terricaulis silvestris]|uniref:TRAP transporter large permease protein n=1 Tax=Terricaulis silvestris TaxID=2686094 RepID=A0A6I6MQY5_9CAUL|nr:TRAP transporter large permease [Terricaulis silvestris]QGZ96581.1 Neu5Ac permease [Terricaulis silvestris]